MTIMHCLDNWLESYATNKIIAINRSRVSVFRGSTRKTRFACYMKRFDFFRWKTDWLALTLVMVLGLSSFGSVLLERQSSDRFLALLGDNWRGAYDILVASPEQDFGAAQTTGLVDSNFVATAGDHGISLQQLEHIRAIHDVEVAAPIGMVGQIRDLSLSPMLNRGTAREGEHSAVVASITSTLERITDSGTQVVSESKGRVSLGAGPGDFSWGFPMGFSPMNSSDDQMIPLGTLPAFPTTILAVDPLAERALLQAGGVTGKFLDPLIDVTPDREIQDRTHAIALSIDEVKFPQQYGGVLGALPENGPQEVIPLIVNDSGPTGNRLRLTVEVSTVEIGDGSIAQSESEWESLHAKGTNPQTFTLESDLTSMLSPFSSALPKLTWPGTTEFSDSGGFSTPATSVRPELIGRPTYAAAPDSVLEAAPKSTHSLPRFMVEPRGMVGPDGLKEPDQAFGTSNRAGTVQSYREPVTTDGTGFSVNIPAPIGTFHSQDLPQDSGEANYVPFGAYGNSAAKRISTQGDTALVPTNLSGLDFTTGTPGAITDLQGGSSLRGESPIDAVRVRVANISGYTAENRGQVTKVAQEISELGLQATVVAGSSLQPVALFLPGGNDQSKPLWVTQDWTTLGAAVRVEEAFSIQQKLLLVVSISIGVLGLLGASVLTATRRRNEVSTLRSMGWSDVQIRNLNLRRALPAVSLMALIVVASGIMTGWSKASLLISGILLVTVCTAMAITLLRSMHTAPEKTASNRGSRPLNSTRALAGRIISMAPGTSITQMFGAASLGLAVAATTAAINQAREASGATRLGDLARDSGLVGSIALGFAGCLGAIITLLLARRSVLAQRKESTLIQQAIGFTTNTIRAIHRDEAFVIGLGGVIAAGALGLILGMLIDLWWIALIAIAGAAAAALFLGLTTNSNERRTP